MGMPPHDPEPLYSHGDVIRALASIRRLVADCGLDHLYACLPRGKKRQRLLHAAWIHEAMDEINRLESIIETGLVGGLK